VSNIHSFHVVVSVPAKTRRDRATGEVTTVAPATRKAVVLEVDVGELERTLCLRAAQNKTGKAVLGGGSITAKVAR
jgi:hypothetical protein